MRRSTVMELERINARMRVIGSELLGLPNGHERVPVLLRELEELKERVDALLDEELEMLPFHRWMLTVVVRELAAIGGWLLGVLFVEPVSWVVRTYRKFR